MADKGNEISKRNQWPFKK